MRLFLLAISLLLFLNLSSKEQEVPTVYDQLLRVNKYWSIQAIPDSLKESHILLSYAQQIQTHLQLVEKTLRSKSTEHLNFNQKQKRSEALTDLKNYAFNAVFPINLHHNTSTPYFIDDYGTACAVGQLIIESKHMDLAFAINASDNYEYIENMNFPELDNWAWEHGFTKQELMWIQPAYFPYCPPGTKKDPKCHDATGCINPDYLADSLLPPYHELFEFNDGSGWEIDTNGWIMSWQGARIGDHRITVTDSVNTVKVYHYTINNIPEININSTIEHQTTSNCNGSATISIQNGKAPYRIELHNQDLQYFSSDSSGNFDSLCSGEYLLVVYDSNHCQKTASFVIDNITGLKEIGLSNIEFYPNPFHYQLYIKFAKSTAIDYKLYSISGKLVKHGKLINESNAISMQELNPGVYFIDFIVEGQHYRQKLIKSQ